MNKRKLFRKILSGSDNIRFGDFVSAVEAFGFIPDRISGSHHIFVHPEIPELMNLQNVKGKAKGYQIRQFISLVEKYDWDKEI